jgi:hydroxyacylglutathione hydrolase
MTTHDIPLSVRAVRAFADNYIWLIDAPRAPARVLVVDPGDAAPVITELRRHGASLAAILLTHHHPDHIGGVADLLASARGPIPVVGPDDDRIALLTRRMADSEILDLPELGLRFQSLHVPGHTSSHIAFFGHGALFCGDTLFSAGCGRLFEGSPAQMRASLARLAALPGATRVFAGHEYTVANLNFASQAEPDNAAADAYRVSVEALRAQNLPSLPSTLDVEIRVNPFLRCENPAVRASAARHAGRELSDGTAVFAALRSWKDGFRA